MNIFLNKLDINKTKTYLNKINVTQKSIILTSDIKNNCI